MQRRRRPAAPHSFQVLLCLPIQKQQASRLASYDGERAITSRIKESRVYTLAYTPYSANLRVI